MKALVLHGPGNFKIENDWPAPEAKEGWAVVKVAYAGVCGSDMPRFFTTGSYHHPMIIGHEFSGVVETPAVGGSVPKGTPVAVMPIIPCGECAGCKKTGEPFHCKQYQFIGSRNDGGFAQYCLVPESNLLRLDSADNLLQGAFIEPLAVGLHTVRRSGWQPGCDAPVVVFGAGPIGLCVSFWLNYFGANLTVVDVRDYSINIAKKMGLKHVVHFDELKDDMLFDYAFEASGASVVLCRALELLDEKGVFTVVGRSGKDVQIPIALFERMQRKEVTLNGCWGYNIGTDEETVREGLKHFNAGALISHMVRPDDIVPVLEQMNAKSMDYCKVMIDFTEEA